MVQKKLVITVYDGDGNVVFSKDPATPDSVMAVLSLFNDVGYEICIAIREFKSDIDNG